MSTYFNISCENWKDDDFPLTYQFMYLSEFGMILLQSGHISKLSTKLLPGSKESNFKLDIITIITDAFEASVTKRFDVTVSDNSADSSLP
jgi:hypothetical protein